MRGPRILAVLVLLASSAVAHGQGLSGHPFLPANESTLLQFAPEFALGESLVVTRGERMRVRAQRLFEEAPDTPEAFEMLVYTERPADALAVLRRIVATDVLRLEHPLALTARRGWIRGPFAEPLRAILADARAQLERRPPQIAARLLLTLVHIENQLAGGDDTTRRTARSAALTAFIERYAGTDAALLAEVDRIATMRSIADQIAPLDDFIARHPGTTAAAKALFHKAAELRVNLARRGEDPTGRFLQILAAAEELESGRYPPSEFVERARWLPTDVFASEPAYAPGSADRLIAAYERFLRRHLAARSEYFVEQGLSAVVGRVAEVAEANGRERVAEVERLLARLEPVHRDRARLLQVQFHLDEMRRLRTSMPERVDRMLSVLQDVETTASEPFYRRKAHATRAFIALNGGRDALARDLYVSYVRQYPESEYGWLATVRAGQAFEALGDVNGAIEWYQAAATRYAAFLPSRVIGQAFAARVAEGEGRIGEALRWYQQALAEWTSAAPRTFSLRPMIALAPRRAEDLQQLTLTDSVARLTRAVAMDGGDQLVRARNLLERGERRQALELLDRTVAASPGSPAAAAARFLSRRARGDEALDLADADAAAPATTAAIALLDVAIVGPWDVGAAIAKMAKATLLWRQGTRADAQALITGALEEWRTEGARLEPSPSPSPSDGTAQDVADIRRYLFQPLGSSHLDAASVERYRWPRERLPYALVNADVIVEEFGGRPQRLTIHQTFPGNQAVLMPDTGQLELLARVLQKLGGARTSAPTAIMQVPNQPAGPAVDLQSFWNRYFVVMPGHWSGWMLETPPMITSIRFADAERTTADVAVTIGYSGGTIRLQKRDGAWAFVSAQGQWIQ